MFYFWSRSMKYLLSFIFIVSCSLPLLSFAQSPSSREAYGNTPIQILDTVVDKANKDFQIQETALDNATSLQSQYSNQWYQITSTLDRVRLNIYPYLQRAVYVGLSVAVILLIYNGFLMVTNAIHKEWDITKVKTNIFNIIIWVIILTGFYFIIRLAAAIITSIFWWFTGSTWF